MIEIPDTVDVMVVGAGPAGSLASQILATRGYEVHLVDKNVFPRKKVCGCCINGRAVDILCREIGTNFLDQLNACWISSMTVRSESGATLALPLGNMRSLSRATLDDALVKQGLAAGVKFYQGIHARLLRMLDDCIVVTLTDKSNCSAIVHCKLLIVADGIGGTTLAGQRAFDVDVKKESLVGVAANSERFDNDFYERGRIYMAYGSGSYLGLVRLEDGSLEIASALSSSFLKRASAPAAAAKTLLRSCDWSVPRDLFDINWIGTVPLTRQRASVACRRVFVIGDAASFVEPFTGEGIAWALESAKSIVPIAIEALRKWDDKLIQKWQRVYSSQVRCQQLRSKSVATLLRHKHVAELSGRLLNGFPKFAGFISKAISG